jgi:hypothetical protein
MNKNWITKAREVTMVRNMYLLQIVTYRLVSSQYMVFPGFVTAGKYAAVAVQ